MIANNAVGLGWFPLLCSEAGGQAVVGARRNTGQLRKRNAKSVTMTV